jgi:hypothetical protein
MAERCFKSQNGKVETYAVRANTVDMAKKNPVLFIPVKLARAETPPALWVTTETARRESAAQEGIARGEEEHDRGAECQSRAKETVPLSSR